MSTIKCYDTLKCMYVEVEVTEEVYTYIKRSYWREDMQDRRYQARKLLFDDVLDYSVTEIDICDEVVKKIEYPLTLPLSSQTHSLLYQSNLPMFLLAYHIHRHGSIPKFV